MSHRSFPAHGRRILVASCLLWSLVASTRLHAQGTDDPGKDAPYRFGALAVEPALVFSSGYDTNVYRERIGFAAVETFAVPQIQAWWIQPGFHVMGQAAVEGVHFTNNVGAVNGQTGLRIERSHSVVVPYLSWNRRRTNASPTGFEVGYKSLRLENDWSGGIALTLSPRVRTRALVRLVKTNWDADARYQSSSLREKLNRDTLGSSLSFSYALTPLTAIGATVETQRDRFQFSPIRDGDAVRIAPMVEFSSPALLFGNAVVGYHRFRSPASGAADFNGVFASVNLGYGAPEGTLFKLYVVRDLQYSHDTALAYYVATSATITLARRIGGRWDAAVFGGRHFLDFRPPAGGADGRPVDSVMELGGAMAYRASPRRRIGLSIERATKNGDDGYNALRVVGFLTYGSGRFQRLDRPTPFER